MKKAFLLISILSLCTLFTLLATSVYAHPPSNMALSYDYDTQILTLTVFHSVSDPNTHFIEQLVINKNSVFALDRNYTSQASPSSMADTFNIDAENNDILQVITICSISGQIIRQITVSSDGLQTQPQPNIPGFPIMAIAIGFVVAVGFAIIRRRRFSEPH